MKIICSQFILRELQKSDAPGLATYANNFNIFINLRDYFPHLYSLEDAIDFINHNLEISPQQNFCIEYNNECVGMIGILPLNDVYHRSGEIGYWLGEPFWGKGIMTEATKIICDWAFENLDIVRLQAGIFQWNKASMRVLEKAGFKLEGIFQKSIFKNGQLIDEHRYALLNH